MTAGSAAPLRPLPPSLAQGRLVLRRERRGPGAVISILVHGAIIAAIFWRGAAALEGAGGGGPGPMGGGGGRGRQRATFFTLPAYSAPVAVDIPTPPKIILANLPPMPAIRLDLAAIAVPRPANAATGDATGIGPGTGGGVGSGAGPGVGSAVGPGTGGDSGYILIASPRSLVLPPPNVPAAMRGHSVKVLFWVGIDGRVTRVETDPRIDDGGYRREFMDRMLSYLFRPATTRDGVPVASVYPVILKLQ